MFIKKIIYIAIVLIAIGLIAYYFFYFRNRSSKTISTVSPVPSASTTVSPTPALSPKSQLADPVKDFKARVTKKPFGIYITPQNSPIQPERFSGYHTGADAEFTDTTADVPVYAVADGKVVLSEYASGYGGVFMIEIQLDGTAHTVLYGHIRPSTLPKAGQMVKRGEQLAILGTGFSSETDGERHHLHFAILSNNRLDIKGYVSTQSQLSGWLDPLKFY